MAENSRNIKDIVPVVETALKMLHDFSGKAHIIQFCCEELGEKLVEDENRKYIERLSSACDELIKQISLSRKILKAEISHNETLTIGQATHEAHQLASIYFWDPAAKQRIVVDPELKGLNCPIEHFCELKEVYFSLFAHFFEVSKSEEMTIEIAGHGQFVLKNAGIAWSESGVREKITPGEVSQKTFRRLQGLNQKKRVTIKWGDPLILEVKADK